MIRKHQVDLIRRTKVARTPEQYHEKEGKPKNLVKYHPLWRMSDYSEMYESQTHWVRNQKSIRKDWFS
ncbi:MAG: hypothetical protein ACJ70T_01275 [Nitrososphaera sp.]